MPYSQTLKPSVNDDQEDSLKKINGILWEGLAGAGDLSPDSNDSAEESLRKINGVLYLSQSGGASNIPDYEIKSASFTAESGKAYAVDKVTTATPEVLPTFEAFGIRYTGNSGGLTTSINGTWTDEDGPAVDWNDNDESTLNFFFTRDVTKGQLVAAINGWGGPVTATLVNLAQADELVYDGSVSGNLSGGVVGATAYSGVEVTLPSNPTPGDVISLADARGTWGSYPVVVIRNGKKIEGVNANFTNNAAGTFFSLLFIDDTTGWRVLSSGTKPLNLSPPTITGTYLFTASNGTWTGSPTSYAYQWQIFDDSDPELGWVDIEGATSASYLATEADENLYVRCGVVATNANGPSAVAYSAASSAIEIPEFPLSGLLAFWKLADLTDASGNGNTLTNNNSVTFAAGKIGNAAQFDANNYLTESLSTPLSLAESTVSFWCKPSALGGANMFFLMASLCACHTDSGGGLNYNNAQSSDVFVSNVFSIGQWAHIVIIHTGGDIIIYKNGVEIYNAGEGVSYNASGSQIRLAEYGYQGLIDAFGLWNRVLTAPEIAQLYNAGAGVEP